MGLQADGNEKRRKEEGEGREAGRKGDCGLNVSLDALWYGYCRYPSRIHVGF